MANIEEILNDIKDSNKIRTGKEMRAKLYEFGKKIYEDKSQEGNANMEVSEARGIFATLNKRLNNSDTVKADKTEVESIKNNLQSQVNGLASGSPLVANSVSEMIDKNRVYINTANNYWYFYDESTENWEKGDIYQSHGISEKQVTLDKIDFETILLNNYTIQNKYVVNFDTTTFTPNFSPENNHHFSTILQITEKSEDIIIPVDSQLNGQLFVAYNENVKAINLDYNYLINHNYSTYYNYNSSTKELTIYLTHLYKDNFKNIAIGLYVDNYYIKIKQSNYENIELKTEKLISGKNIKDNTITKSNIGFNLLEFDGIVNNYNVFDLANCEYKYSPNYDATSKLPNFTESNDFLTLIIQNSHKR